MSKLTDIEIPSSVTSIGVGAFSDCSGLTSVVWNAIECDDFSYSPFGSANISSFTFGDEVQKIPAYLCKGQTQLTSVTIPESVSTIGQYAFNGCSGLTALTIPKSVTSIGTSAFNGCSGLTSVVWNVKTHNDFTSSSSPFASAKSSIVSFTFGEEVQSIPAYLCYGMSSLTSLEFPASIKEFGSSAFYGCSNVTKVTFRGELTSIGENAFRTDGGGTSKITDVYANMKNPPICAKAFFSKSGSSYVGATNAILHVPKGTKLYYQAREDWKYFTFIIDDLELKEQGDEDAVADVVGIHVRSGDIVLGTINEETLIPVSIQNTGAVSGFAFTVTLPERVLPVDDVASFVTATDRGGNFVLTTTQNDDGSITVSGTAATPLAAGDDAILNLHVTTAWQNNYTIPVTGLTVTTAAGEERSLPDSVTTLVMQGLRGDMNGDGKVDVTDALYIYNLSLGLVE